MRLIWGCPTGSDASQRVDGIPGRRTLTFAFNGALQALRIPGHHAIAEQWTNCRTTKATLASGILRSALQINAPNAEAIFNLGRYDYRQQTSLTLLITGPRPLTKAEDRFLRW
jgi:hypothetical protein